ncbi:hypothetical protein SDC9_95714 [bioreactor metagenome]|uniref:Uncharacterized protein n=1 Tax=bioreactor metagenome TaxID=1076179 RepID=A0A645A7E6_9ZZZZ
MAQAVGRQVDFNFGVIDDIVQLVEKLDHTGVRREVNTGKTVISDEVHFARGNREVRKRELPAREPKDVAD